MHENEPIQAFLFDLDGTLIDTVPQLHAAVQFAMQCNDFPSVTLEQVRGWIGNGVDILLYRAISQNSDYHVPATDVFTKIKQSFNESYMQGIKQNYRLYSDVIKTLKFLHAAGLKLAVVTNKPDPFVKPLLADAGILNYFSVTLGGGVLKEKKPHPAPLLHVCELMNIDFGSAVMVGDSKNDIEAAHAAGIRSVGLTYGYNYSEPIEASHPNWVFDRFEQLADLVSVDAGN